MQVTLHCDTAETLTRIHKAVEAIETLKALNDEGAVSGEIVVDSAAVAAWAAKALKVGVTSTAATVKG